MIATPDTASSMVHSCSGNVSTSWTSLKPTVVSVITVMYIESVTGHPNRTTYPTVPRIATLMTASTQMRMCRPRIASDMIRQNREVVALCAFEDVAMRRS